jgi:hypothetical protein
MSFADQIETWQAFFTTVAGLAATLAGLLFVGLGLNPRIMAPNGPPACGPWPRRPSTTSWSCS